MMFVSLQGQIFINYTCRQVYNYTNTHIIHVFIQRRIYCFLLPVLLNSTLLTAAPKWQSKRSWGRPSAKSCPITSHPSSHPSSHDRNGGRAKHAKNNSSVAPGLRQHAIDKHAGQSLMQIPQKWFSANKTVSSLRQLQNQGKYNLDNHSCKGKEFKVPRIFHRRSVKEEQTKHSMQCFELLCFMPISMLQRPLCMFWTCCVCTTEVQLAGLVSSIFRNPRFSGTYVGMFFPIFSQHILLLRAILHENEHLLEWNILAYTDACHALTLSKGAKRGWAFGWECIQDKLIAVVFLSTQSKQAKHAKVKPHIGASIPTTWKARHQLPKRETLFVPCSVVNVLGAGLMETSFERLRFHWI